MKFQIINNKIFLILILSYFFNISKAFCQNVGIGTTSPDASAMVDITSSTKGLLIPSMITTKQNSIPATTGGTSAAPAAALTIYNTSSNSLNSNIGSATTPNWSSAWGTSGNFLLSSGNQFLGTTNKVNLRYRTNNIERMAIDSSSGYAGIGLIGTATTIATPTSTLQVNGSFATTITNVPSSTTSLLLDQTYYTILVSPGSGVTITVNLPDATLNSGRLYTFKLLTTGGTLYIAPFNSGNSTYQKIDNYFFWNTGNGHDNKYLITTKNYATTIQSDGLNWLIR